MASQASIVPVGFCNICGGRGHDAQFCPSNVDNVPLCFHCGTSGHVASKCTEPPARKCGNCYGVGHWTYLCTSSPGGGRDRVSDFPEIKAITVSHCDRCGGSGHYVTWCGSRSKTGNPLCFRCGDESHTEELCCSLVVAPKCDMCRGVGHSKKDCSNISRYVVVNCQKCSNEGHVDRDCPKTSKDEFPDWYGYDACATCGQTGHYTGGCGSYIDR